MMPSQPPVAAMTMAAATAASTGVPDSLTAGPGPIVTESSRP